MGLLRQKKKDIEAGLIIAIIALGIGFIGLTKATSNISETQQFESGIATVNIALGANVGLSSVSFPKPFTLAPTIAVTVNPTFQQFVTPFNFWDSLPFIVPTAGTTVWTAQPSAETEFQGLTVYRSNMLFRGTNQISISANVQSGGATNAILKAQYFNSTSSTWIDLCGANTDKPFVNITSTGNILGGACNIVSPLVQSNSGQQVVRIAGKNGNGVTSPTFGDISIQVNITIGFSAIASIFGPSTTGFTLVVMTFANQNTATTFTVEWTAWVCINKTNIC